jgi:ABC-2 type transport system ATP-binding protein
MREADLPTPEPAHAAPESGPALLSVRELAVSLGERVVLDTVSLEVRAGELVAVFGPRGAGKTTLLAAIAGLARPERGVLRLEGRELSSRHPTLRTRLGVVLAEPSLDPELSPREHLLYAARLFDVPARDAASRTQELLAFAELGILADEPCTLLSPGQRRRLDLARALIHEPDLLVLDEPTTGLERREQARLWHGLAGLRKLRGTAVLVMTAVADEAVRCDHVVMLDRGHAVATDTPARLLARLQDAVLQLGSADPQALTATLQGGFGLRVTSVDATGVVVRGPRLHALVAGLVDAIPPPLLGAVTLRRPDLAEVFAELTGHGFESGDAGAP